MEGCLMAELELVRAANARRPIIAHVTQRALASMRHAVAETGNLSRAAVNKVICVV